MEVTLSCEGRPFIFSGEEDDPYFRIWRDLGFYGGKRDVVPYQWAMTRKDPVCIDIGGNIGLTAVLTKALAPDSKIYLFEPVLQNLSHLRSTIAKNNFKDCVTIHAAIGEKRGRVRIFESHGHSHIPNFDRQGSEVDVYTLDEWVTSERLDRLDFLKIDVEGYEQKVLQGAKQTIAKFQPISLIEFNSLTTITVGRLLPQDLLNDILSVFPIVDVVEIHTGLPKRLGRTEEEKNHFIGMNLTNGFIHDLLCYFREGQIRPRAEQ